MAHNRFARPRWITAAILVLSLAAAGMLQRRKESSADASQTVSVARRPLVEVIPAVGAVWPRTRSLVWPATPGRVRKIWVSRGMRVSVHAPLYDLAPLMTNDDVERALIAKQRADIRLKQALEDAAAGKRSAYDVELARLDVRSAELDLAGKRTAARPVCVTAPIDGVVIAIAAREGDLVTPAASGPPPVIVGEVGEYVVEAEGDDPRLPLVTADSHARVRVETQGAPISGSVLDVPTLKRLTTGLSNQTVYALSIKFSSDAPVLPGTMASVQVEVTLAPSALAIPSAAVEMGEQGTFVHVATPRGIERRRVATGRTAGDLVEVVHGLDPADRILISPPNGR